MGKERLSYHEVEEASGRMAAILVEQGCRKGDRVALLIPKSPIAVIAIHAVLKAGCAYVPLDSESPAPRIAHILRAAEPVLLLTVSDQAKLVDEIAGEVTLPAVGLVDIGDFEAAKANAAFGRNDWETMDPLGSMSVASDDIAHLLFTSGSTGVPKGVMITHHNVDSFISWALEEFGTKPGDRISGHPPLHFDLSTFDIFGTFAAGAELHLVPASFNLNPRGLGALIRDSELTQWFSVPSALALMTRFKVVQENDFPALERLIWCGEVLPTPILKHWMQRLPHVRFTNLYGPTEATIASSYFHIPALPVDDAAPIPIGSPCKGEELLVLDDALQPVANDEVGDLFIAGVGLSPGYWRDKEKTDAAFIADPRESSDGRIYRTGDLARVDSEGLFHFLGRADSQIKSRGYRIELGEIETVLGALPGVGECAVVGVELGGFEGTAIAAAIALEDGASIDTLALRKRLLESLPGYMIPARWLDLPSLPKNQNGKIDRPALRSRFEAQEQGSVV